MELQIATIGREMLTIAFEGKLANVEVLYVTEMQGDHKVATPLDLGLDLNEFREMRMGSIVAVLLEAERIFHLMHNGGTT